MGFFDGYNVSTSGMSAQRTRINVVSANIANAKTTHTIEGGPYKKQQVVFEDILIANSKKTNTNDVETTNSKNSDISLRGVGVKSIVQSDAKPVMRYEPTHPDADENGYVAYPDINTMEEMANLIEASRSYEANITALNTTKSMAIKDLEIGK